MTARELANLMVQAHRAEDATRAATSVLRAAQKEEKRTREIARRLTVEAVNAEQSADPETVHEARNLVIVILWGKLAQQKSEGSHAIPS